MAGPGFEELVMQALERLPTEFSEKLANVDVVVEPLPTPGQVRKLKLCNPLQLLGLYEGVPQTRRSLGYTLVLPDKITLFQKSIEAKCRSNHSNLAAEIEAVLRHEIAHHFGMGDAELRRIENEKRRRKRGT